MRDIVLRRGYGFAGFGSTKDADDTVSQPGVARGMDYNGTRP